MTDRLVEAVRRTRGYRFIDGLAEIGAGILFMALSIPYLLWSLSPQGSKLASFASKGRDVVLILGLALLFVVIWGIKPRSTYSRSGYLKEKRPGGGRVVAAIAISAGLLLSAGLLAAGLMSLPGFGTSFLQGLYYFPTIVGLILALSLVAWGSSNGIKRFHWLAEVAFVTSVGLAVSTRMSQRAHPFDWSYFTSANPNASMPAGVGIALEGLFRSIYGGTAIFMAVFGLAMLVSGVIARRKYLRENPIPSPLEQEEAK